MDSDTIGARWRLIELPKVRDPRGNLTFIENGSHLPFDMGAVRWFYDIPSGTVMKPFAFNTNRQLIVCLSGRFEVELRGVGGEKHSLALDSPDTGLLVEPGVSVTLSGFVTNSVGLQINSLDNPAGDINRHQSTEETAYGTT